MPREENEAERNQKRRRNTNRSEIKFEYTRLHTTTTTTTSAFFFSSNIFISCFNSVREFRFR